MPYYNFRKIWTPLELFRVYFYKETIDQSLWVKMGNGKRRRLFDK